MHRTKYLWETEPATVQIYGDATGDSRNTAASRTDWKIIRGFFNGKKAAFAPSVRVGSSNPPVKGAAARRVSSCPQCKMGAVLGTVLFELLDQFRDFEVIQVGSGRRTSARKASDEMNGAAQEQSADFFYTDAKAETVDASLVQPLGRVGTPEAPKMCLR